MCVPTTAVVLRSNGSGSGSGKCIGVNIVKVGIM